MRVKIKAKIAPSRAELIPITTEYIKLDSLLKLANLCESGGLAKTVIAGGLVRVNGEICTQRGRKLRPGDRVELEGKTIEVAGPGDVH